LGASSGTGLANYGVMGTGPNGGVYGVGVGASSEGALFSGESGVWGDTNSSGSEGVLGTADDANGGFFVNNSPSAAYALVGYATNSSENGELYGVGVYGEAVSNSTTGTLYGYGAGVWGDTNVEGGISNGAVQGTADDNGAATFLNNSSNYETIFAENFAAGAAGSAPVVVTRGQSGTCTIDVGGNVGCTGDLSTDAAVDGAARRVSLYSMQSAENWFEDAGSGQLSNGAASIAIDPTFAQTVNTGVDYHVFLTPNGDCKGLYVSQKTATSFEVHELGAGTSSTAFDYRIMAKRAGYESKRLEDVTVLYQRLEQQEQLRQKRVGQHRAWRPPARPVAAAMTQHR
jgi:hypothetical protein